MIRIKRGSLCQKGVDCFVDITYRNVRAVFVGAIRSVVVQIRPLAARRVVCFTAADCVICLFLSYVNDVRNDEAIRATMPWIPSLHISFDVYVDGLSLLFALLITGIGTLVVLYSIYYLQKEKNSSVIFTYICFYLWALCSVLSYLTISLRYTSFGN